MQVYPAHKSGSFYPEGCLGIFYYIPDYAYELLGYELQLHDVLLFEPQPVAVLLRSLYDTLYRIIRIIQSVSICPEISFNGTCRTGFFFLIGNCIFKYNFFLGNNVQIVIWYLNTVSPECLIDAHIHIGHRNI